VGEDGVGVDPEGATMRIAAEGRGCINPDMISTNFPITCKMSLEDYHELIEKAKKRRQWLAKKERRKAKLWSTCTLLMFM
jgi:hypothetical protein